MFRSILSVLGGAAVGVFTISFIQYLSHQLYPLPSNLDVNDQTAMSAALNNAPATVLLLVLLAYALGSFLGGMVAARYAPGRPVLHALLVGVLLLAAGIANLWVMPHPMWFVVASVLVYLPMAYFGGTMSMKRMP
jgi:MFS family permease